jgi:hypothetical protein
MTGWKDSLRVWLMHNLPHPSLRKALAYEVPECCEICDQPGEPHYCHLGGYYVKPKSGSAAQDKTVPVYTVLTPQGVEISKDGQVQYIPYRTTDLREAQRRAGAKGQGFRVVEVKS